MGSQGPSCSNIQLIHKKNDTTTCWNGRRAGAAADDEQGVQLSQPLLSSWPVHDRGADGAGDGGQPPDRWLLRRPPAGSTSARARCPAPACLPSTALGLPVLLLVLLLVHLLVHVPLQLFSRLR